MRLSCVILCVGIALSCADPVLADGANGSSGGAGSFVKISTQTANNTATFLQFVNLTSDYNTYFFDCNALVPATNAIDFDVQVAGAGPVWRTANYFGSLVANNSGNLTPIGQLTSAGTSLSVTVIGNVANTVADAIQSVSIKLWISNPSVTGISKQIIFDSAYATTAPFAEQTHGGGAYYGDGNAIIGIRIITSAGNIVSGQCTEYGLSP